MGQDGKTNALFYHLTHQVGTVEADAQLQLATGTEGVIVYQVLHRAARGKADELAIESFTESNFTPSTERMPQWGHQDQADLCERKILQLRGWINGLPDNADIAAPRGDGSDNLAASVVLKVDVDIRMRREKGRQGRRQKLRRADIR